MSVPQATPPESNPAPVNPDVASGPPEVATSSAEGVPLITEAISPDTARPPSNPESAEPGGDINAPGPPDPPDAPANAAPASPSQAEVFGPPRPMPPRRAYERKPTGPRRVRDALKLRALKEDPPSTVLGQRWLDLIQRAVSEEEWREGVEYAKVGQVASLAWTETGLEVKVQGRQTRPYLVHLTLAPLADSTWHELVTRMCTEAIFAVRLLAAEAPKDVHELFESVGVMLVPDDVEAVQSKCPCGRPKPCRHVVAAGYLAADRFEVEPLRILGLRGMPADQVLERLRHARELHTRGIAAAHADPLIPESRLAPPPLEECLDDFWRPGTRLGDAEHAPPPHHVPHALLRRLGPSPLEGKFPLVGLLASIYDSVSAYADRLRNSIVVIEDEVEAEDDDPPDELE